LFIGCEGGEVEEEEVEVVDGAPNNSRGCEGKVFPGIRYSGTLCEKMEGGFGGRPAFRTSWRGCEAESVAASLEGENVVKGCKTGIN
jgi:hypothetical protein